MPHYYWELDFSYDRRKSPAEWIGQTIEVNDDGQLIYEADKRTSYSWQDAYGCGDFIHVQSIQDAIDRLELHRSHVVQQLAGIDAVLEAARKADSFWDFTSYDDEDGPG